MFPPVLPSCLSRSRSLTGPPRRPFTPARFRSATNCGTPASRFFIVPNRLDRDVFFFFLWLFQIALVKWATVEVDGHSVPADSYLGDLSHNVSACICAGHWAFYA